MAKRTPLLALIGCLAVGAVLVLTGVLPHSCGTTQNATIEVPEAYADRITVHEEGEFTYTYPANSLAFDADTEMLYASDTLLAILDPTVDNAERRTLAQEAHGTIVGNLTKGANIVQIILDAPADLPSLQALADTLMEREGVLFASPEVPVLSGATESGDGGASAQSTVTKDANGWGDGGTVDESPSGNNWWAEAIGAYTAWELADISYPVTVGVLDSGVNFGHEDLEDAGEQLSGYTTSSPDTHGTAVASLIAARDNDSGLRGVAGSSDDGGAHILAVDYTANNGVFSSTGDLLGLLNAFVLSDQLFSGGAKVINCSFGINSVSWLQALEELVQNPFDGADALEDLIMHKYSIAMQNRMARATSDMCLSALASMLNDDDTAELEFLIVQSAGNDLVHGEPTEAWRNGYFAGIGEKRFLERFPEGSCGSVTYEDVEERLLTVGAAGRPVYGSLDRVPLSEDSCYGTEWVDICAPSPHKDIYAADAGGGYAPFGDTSAAAPIVSGAAALLWSINPDLSAAEMRELLCTSTDHVAERTTGSGPYDVETYPLLDVGQAVRDLLLYHADAYRLQVQVVDSDTNEPVADAEVTFTPADDDAGGGESTMLTTDSDGIVSLDDTEKRLYDLVVVAEGYETNDLYRFDTDALDDASDEAHTNVVRLHPSAGTDAQGAFAETIDRLVDTYGVVATGTEQYAVHNSRGTPVSAERLSGLLCADVFDYDDDGSDELLALRLDPAGGWEVSDTGEWTPVSLVIEIYEEEDGEAKLAATETATVEGLPDYYPLASLHVFCGEHDGAPMLYVDMACDFNHLWFSTVGLSYDDGEIACQGGAAMSEHYNSTLCCEAADGQALRTLLELSSSGSSATVDGWRELSRVTWDDSDPVPEDARVTNHRESYAEALARIGLTDEAPRGYYVGYGPADDDPFYTCKALPLEHLASTDGSELTALCGVSSVSASSPSTLELTVYDESATRDAYR